MVIIAIVAPNMPIYLRFYPYIVLLIIVLTAPAASKEVAYVYGEGGGHVSQNLNLTAHGRSESISYAVSLGDENSRELNKIKNASADEIKSDIRRKINLLNRDVIKEGSKITGNISGDKRIDQICSIYEYLVRNWIYKADWKGQDYFQYSNESLEYGKDVGKCGKGDCDDFSILLAALIESVGGTPRIIFAYGPQGGHAYAQVYIGQDTEYNSKVARMIEWLQFTYGVKEVYTIKDDETNDVWLNLDWWKDPLTSKDKVKHPGGPLFNANDFIIAYSDENRNNWIPLSPVPVRPQARLSISKDNPNALENITFDGSMSKDADTEITAWNWDFGDDEKCEGKTVIHRYNHGGKYNVTLNVTDNDDEVKWSLTNQTISVNGLPIPIIDYSPRDPQLIDEINFDASRSRDSDPDGWIKNYNWNFGDGDQSIRKHPSPHEYETNGSYTICLEVEDDKGARNATSLRIKINLPPNALFEYSPSRPIILQNITFNAKNSKDSDGNISSYYWDFGDNCTEKGMLASHTYSNRGNYTVRLTVTDSENARSNVSIPIRVIQPPIAAFHHTPEKPEVDETVIFNASESTCIDGNIIKYIWEFYDGYNPGPLGMPEVTKKFSRSMEYRVTLRVIDSNGIDNNTTENVIINDKPGKPRILSFQAVPNNISSGEKITLSWSVSGAKKVIINPDIGEVLSNGSESISLINATTFTLIALNEADQGSTATTLVNIIDKIEDQSGDDSSLYRTASSMQDAIIDRIEPDNNLVREMALGLLTQYPGELSINQICAIYDYLRGNWSYMVDPQGNDTLQYSNQSIRYGMTTNSAGVGDSEDFAILMASLIESIGGTARIVLADGPDGVNAYSEVYLGNAQSNNIKKIIQWIERKYNVKDVSFHKDLEAGDLWLNLDMLAGYPGGPFYSATSLLPINISKSFIKTSVAPVREPPKAIIMISPPRPSTGEVLLFNASLSNSSGNIEKYYWDFGDGTSAEGILAEHIYQLGGNFIMNLTIVDNNGEKGFNLFFIEVNEPPMSKFLYDPEHPLPGETVEFNATNSMDSDGSISRFDWDFGDGSRATGPLVKHTFAEGNYSVSLTVTDDRGATNTSNNTIGCHPPITNTIFIQEILYPYINYLWILQNINKNSIFLAIESDDNGIITGKAKYEGEDSNPWNGIVKGYVTPYNDTLCSDVTLVITETKGANMTMNITKLKGTYVGENETIMGNYIRVDNRGKMAYGTFEATWISQNPFGFRFGEDDGYGTDSVNWTGNESML